MTGLLWDFSGLFWTRTVLRVSGCVESVGLCWECRTMLRVLDCVEGVGLCWECRTVFRVSDCVESVGLCWECRTMLRVSGCVDSVGLCWECRTMLRVSELAEPTVTVLDGDCRGFHATSCHGQSYISTGVNNNNKQQQQTTIPKKSSKWEEVYIQKSISPKAMPSIHNFLIKVRFVVCLLVWRVHYFCLVFFLLVIITTWVPSWVPHSHLQLRDPRLCMKTVVLHCTHFAPQPMFDESNTEGTNFRMCLCVLLYVMCMFCIVFNLWEIWTCEKSWGDPV